jgi:hypothetical protein
VVLGVGPEKLQNSRTEASASLHYERSSGPWGGRWEFPTNVEGNWTVWAYSRIHCTFKVHFSCYLETVLAPLPSSGSAMLKSTLHLMEARCNPVDVPVVPAIN